MTGFATIELEQIASAFILMAYADFPSACYSDPNFWKRLSENFSKIINYWVLGM